MLKEIVERLESASWYTLQVGDDEGYEVQGREEVVNLKDAIDIVQEVAKEYASLPVLIDTADTGNLEEMMRVVKHMKVIPVQTDGGWIPCSERLPEESGEYYTYVYYDGHYIYSVDEIDCDGMIKKWNCSSDYQIIAWKPIAPYQKGE